MLLGSQSNAQSKGDNWILEKEGDGIKIYTRISEGSTIKEFKALTTSTQPIEWLANLIDDVENYPNWQANITTATLLKQVNATEKYIHYTTDTPWPITDRDVAIHAKKTKKENGAVLFTLTSVPNYIAEKEDFIRLKISNGSWEFTPIENNKIDVTYRFYGDPEGSLPEWLINVFIVTGPYETLTNMNNME